MPSPIERGTRIGEPTPLGTPAAFEGGLVELATGVWAWLQPNGGLGESNAGLAVGDGGSLLVDTLWDAPLTARMLEAMAPVTEAAEAPIEVLFNTHGDGDHWYGNAEVAPGVEIVATDAANEQMREEPPAMLTRLSPVGPVAGLAGRLPLLPGTAHFRGLAAFGDALGNYEFAGLEPRRPDRRFSGSLGLEVGGLAVELIEVGPAHSVGDAIAWLPEPRVLFAGDIVFSGTVPLMWAGPVGNWLAALDQMLELEPAVVLGGHGPPGGVERLETVRAYWTWLRDETLAAPDESVIDLAERLVNSARTTDKPWADWLYPERTLVNVARIRDTSEPGAGPLSTLARIRLLGAMGALAERLK